MSVDFLKYVLLACIFVLFVVIILLKLENTSLKLAIRSPDKESDHPCNDAKDDECGHSAVSHGGPRIIWCD